jgi:prepilin-type N-terminal cleavage/methylation domain-containing protein
VAEKRGLAPETPEARPLLPGVGVGVSLTSAPRQKCGRGTTRAFTLIELMVVVILISILTVLAMPTMGEARFSAHTLDDATKIAELYREARTRAMARGAAMMVQGASANTYGSFQASPSINNGGLGVFLLYEAQVPGGVVAGSPTVPLPGGSPINTCGMPTTNWASITSPANALTSLIDEVNLNTTIELQADIWSTLADPSATIPTAQSLCYTPLGRTYYQAVANPVFTPGVNLLHGVLQIAVQRSGIGGPVVGITRTVVVPDSGSTRIISQ